MFAIGQGEGEGEGRRMYVDVLLKYVLLNLDHCDSVQMCS